MIKASAHPSEEGVRVVISDVAHGMTIEAAEVLYDALALAIADAKSEAGDHAKNLRVP